MLEVDAVVTFAIACLRLKNSWSPRKRKLFLCQLFTFASDYALGGEQRTDSNAGSMRPVRSILVYFSVIFLGGALLAPLVYHFVQAAAESWPSLQSIANQPFRRFVTRSFMILGAVGLWPFLRSLGLRSWSEAGLCPPKGQWGKLLTGFIVGFGSLALIVIIVIGGGARTVNPELTAASFYKHLLNAGLAAILVPVIEELFFRGALMGALRKCYDWRLAVLFSSLIYAAVHFLENVTADPQVTWASGLALLPRMMRGFHDVQTLIPGFFNLTLAGILLGLAYQRTGNLYFSFGLHGGWIFWLKSYGLLTRKAEGASDWFWGTGKLIDGWLALTVLIVLLWPMNRWFTREPARSSA